MYACTHVRAYACVDNMGAVNRTLVQHVCHFHNVSEAAHIYTIPCNALVFTELPFNTEFLIICYGFSLSLSLPTYSSRFLPLSLYLSLSLSVTLCPSLSLSVPLSIRPSLLYISTYLTLHKYTAIHSLGSQAVLTPSLSAMWATGMTRVATAKPVSRHM